MKYFLLFIASISFAFNLNTNNYSEKFIKECVSEVFLDKADELVFSSESRRLEIITDFFNRIEIEHRPEYRGKQFTLVSSLGLNNKYNSNLRFDDTFNPDTFNPLKYNFPFSTTKRELYRFDNSDYIIILNNN